MQNVRRIGTIFVILVLFDCITTGTVFVTSLTTTPSFSNNSNMAKLFENMDQSVGSFIVSGYFTTVWNFEVLLNISGFYASGDYPSHLQKQLIN